MAGGTDMISEQGSVFWKQCVAKEDRMIGISYDDQERVPTSLTGTRQLTHWQRTQPETGGFAHSAGGYVYTGQKRRHHESPRAIRAPPMGESGSSFAMTGSSLGSVSARSYSTKVFGKQSFHQRPD